MHIKVTIASDRRISAIDFIYRRAEIVASEHMKKGISLPIEVIVVVAIAVLVLVVIAAVFMGGVKINPGEEQAFTSLCLALRTDCAQSPSTVTITGVFDINQDGKIDSTDIANLGTLCQKKGALDDNACRVRCGCPAQ